MFLVYVILAVLAILVTIYFIVGYVFYSFALKPNKKMQIVIKKKILMIQYGQVKAKS